MIKYLMMGVSVLIACGCAQEPKYYWGSYEQNLYDHFHNSGKATPQYQIEKMEADILKAQSKNKPLPPGFYAHLGFQYLQAGKFSEARQGFEMEKKNYPESATLMNRFIKKLK